MENDLKIKDALKLKEVALRMKEDSLKEREDILKKKGGCPGIGRPHRRRREACALPRPSRV